MIPKDPIMLLSYINTKLRDEFDSLDELCASMDISETELREKLGSVGYEYKEEQNRFI